MDKRANPSPALRPIKRVATLLDLAVEELTPLQAARVWERYELICEQRRRACELDTQQNGLSSSHCFPPP